MAYFDEIRKLTKLIATSVVDFSQPRDKASPPTQAYSNFITNKEQGDWAENLIFNAINTTSSNYVAVKYGKSDDLIAGEEGFEKFYNNFQDELDTIGKRPDLLIFRKEDYESKRGNDISKIEHSQIEEYVKKAIAGLEIRSSAFLIDKYEDEINNIKDSNIKKALQLKEQILSEYPDVIEELKQKESRSSSIKTLEKYIESLNEINEQTIFSFEYKNQWRKNKNFSKLSDLFRELKECIKMTQDAVYINYLSITPKVEDLKVVYKWIEKFEVPHYYIQVFFDKSYGVSFLDILSFIADPNKKSEYYKIGKDEKNQNKWTIKINTRKTTQIAYKIIEPKHHSVRREMDRGRLLYHVKFEDGTAHLDIEGLKKLLKIEDF